MIVHSRSWESASIKICDEIGANVIKIKNRNVVLTIIVGTLSRYTTSDHPETSPARGDCGRSSGGRCRRSGETSRMQTWSWLCLGSSTGLWVDVVFGRPRAARMTVPCVLCVLRLHCLLFLCPPCFPCFLFVDLYLSCRVVPRFGLHQRDVNYICATLLQLDAFVNAAISRVKERVSGPLQKAQLGRRAARIVIVASGWRGYMSRGCTSM